MVQKIFLINLKDDGEKYGDNYQRDKNNIYYIML